MRHKKLYKIDGLFSKYIRSLAAWKCERCGTQYEPPTQALHCSHFYGRARKSVRFDPDNCAALCHGCHRYFTSQPIEHVTWFKKRLGKKRFGLLTLRANTTKRLDVAMINLWIQHKLKELTYEKRK